VATEDGQVRYGVGAAAEGLALIEVGGQGGIGGDGHAHGEVREWEDVQVERVLAEPDAGPEAGNTQHPVVTSEHWGPLGRAKRARQGLGGQPRCSWMGSRGRR
jgi:hypothetical protein